ncbi:hypothetical protein [Halobacillus salinus]|uniref:hypothetical protein n=1 Tax=Halobacillus salinus TaxID=192814 RepID=UPI0009A7644C|nr:hypothetical protein [Halobacillus salinus]
MELRSKQLGSVLKKFLWLDIGLTVLLAINIIIVPFVGMEEGFLSYDSILSIILSIVVFTYSIIFLFWIYKVHKDLQDLYNAYPTTPGGALAKVLIPFYNLYGLWDIYARMATLFKQKSSTEDAGNRLAAYVPFYYVLYFATTVFNAYLAGQALEETFTTTWLISYIADTALVVMYLLIIKVVSTGLTRLSEQEKEDEYSTGT